MAGTNPVADSTVSHLDPAYRRSASRLILAPNARTWIDLGAGAGFPGLVIACALADMPGASVHLVESKQKKGASARMRDRTVSRPWYAQRIEDFTGPTSRTSTWDAGSALAPLDKLLGYANPLLKRRVGLFSEGQDVRSN